MRRTINIPLKLKITALIAILLLAAIGFYLNFALTMFSEDKAADIQLIALAETDRTYNKIENLIEAGIQTSHFSEIILAQNEKTISSMYSKNKFENIFCLSDEGQLKSTLEKEIDKTMSADEVNSIHSIALEIILKNQGRKIHLLRDSSDFYKDSFLIFEGLKKCLIQYSITNLDNFKNTDHTFESAIITKKGDSFFNINIKNLTNYKELTEILKQSQTEGVKRITKDEFDKIVSFKKISNIDLYVISGVDYENAYRASRVLINKSIYFGLLILSASLIAGILFARKLTYTLSLLTHEAEEIKKGNLNDSTLENVKLSNDEIGILSQTLISMKKSIIDFMEEMKQKYRLENEVKVAQIVQKSFFPKNEILKNKINITGHYTPASECGGDWWGYLEQGDLITVIICDATGHGVPAALMTAAANSTLNNIILDAKSLYMSPRNILERFNDVVSLMNTEIQLTAFVLEINTKDGKIKYSNASHQPALIFRKNENAEYLKDNIVSLQENNNPRIGENFGNLYKENQFILTPDDFIVLYTDGIIEQKKDDKAYGQRNFLKIILEKLNQQKSLNSNSLTKTFIDSFFEFCDNHNLQDDVTFLSINFNKEISSIQTIDFEQNHEILVNNIFDINEKIENAFIIHSELENSDNIDNIISKYKITHLIGKNSIDAAQEKFWCEKLNFSFDQLIYEKKINSMNDSKIALNELIYKLDKANLSGISVPTINLVCEELLSNNNNHNQFKEKESFFKVEASENYLAITISFNSAMPTYEQVTKSISRANSEKTPLEDAKGAGLGLYLIFLKVHQVWFIKDTKLNTIRLIVERFQRNINSDKRTTSFHYIERI